MKLCELLGDDDAVSTVLIVLLMVAITVALVILGSVAASFMLGMDGGGGEVQPNTNFNISFDENEGAPNTLNITLTEGDVLSPENLFIRGSIDGQQYDVNWTSDGVFAAFSGTDYRVDDVGGFGPDDDEVQHNEGIEISGVSGGEPLKTYDLRVLWVFETDDHSDSAVLAEFERA